MSAVPESEFALERSITWYLSTYLHDLISARRSNQAFALSLVASSINDTGRVLSGPLVIEAISQSSSVTGLSNRQGRVNAWRTSHLQNDLQRPDTTHNTPTPARMEKPVVVDELTLRQMCRD